MSPAPSPPESSTLVFLSALFILSFFLFFSYSGLLAYFTFDDGTTVIACLHLLETSFWRDLLHILTVFTVAFRPLTTLFWRPLYAMFGFSPLPYRIVLHLLLIVNIGLTYVLARRLEMTRGAAALATLVFCYNASTSALYYDTCLVGDVICFLFYILAAVIYIDGRRTGSPLGWGRIAGVMITYFLALDSKELAVTLPGILVIYEVTYRRQDFGDKRKMLWVASVPAAMLVAGAIYLKVKVADMSHNPSYSPHVTTGFMLKNLGFYLQQLLYLPNNSVSPVNACLMVGAMIAIGALLRSRAAVFGILFFVAALVPVAVIESRTGYAAYIPYFGLAVAVGAVLSGVFGRFGRFSAVTLFVVMAALLGWAHLVRRMPANGYFEWDKPKLVTLMNDFKRTIPEFPPNARVLLIDKVWEPDWGPMFLLRLMYHDNSIWVDRPGNMNRPPDLATYDLVVAYQAPDIDLLPVRFFKHPMKWEIRGKASVGTGQFEVSSPNAGGVSHIDFVTPRVRSNQTTTVTIPGLSNVAVNALYRWESGTRSVPRLVENWCTLDANGSCSITAPSTVGKMIVDWIQPANRRWIFVGGMLSITE